MATVTDQVKIRGSTMWYSILQVPRCRIQSISFIRSTKYVSRLTENLFTLRSYFGLIGSNGFEVPQGHAFHGRWILLPISARIRQRTRNFESNEPRSNHRREFSDWNVKQSTKNKAVSSSFTSIKYSDAEPIKILERGDSNHKVRIFVIDIETTGFSRYYERIIEIAIRDLSGGENSCFQTLVNPKKYVRNSYIHGITTKMVNQPYVPRMEDLIPILIKYTNSRQLPGELALVAAHNARRFDVPFLATEFSHCMMEIPDNWLFLDTLPLARELMKLKGSMSSKLSLQALRKYYEIPMVGSAHRAMSDVNLLSSVLERMASDLKLTVPDLLARSFRPFLDNPKKNKSKS